MTLVRYMLVTAFLLGVFALVGTGIVAVTQNGTEERIRQNEREFLLRTLNSVIPATAYDNDLHADTITVTSHELLGTRKPVTVYRARKDNKPVAAVLTPVAPDGYNGDIHLLVAIRYDGVLMGVRVLSHRETPGLGDGIDIERSNWIDTFAGHSLHDPDELGWHVVKDGGIFDQFTGATISPRAVVKAVHNSLKYYAQHKEALFRNSSSGEVHPDGATDVH
jgi:electron transport complex protein RnfG